MPVELHEVLQDMCPVLSLGDKTRNLTVISTSNTAAPLVIGSSYMIAILLMFYADVLDSLIYKRRMHGKMILKPKHGDCSGFPDRKRRRAMVQGG